ncbi:hypothetical protein N7510_001821 [Penicillium lagena]|uniref:uncharacterized protein n=1 Tax=Penicillium lagena TaxID=94218 RepID=UPI00253FA1AC|nr:uncharacterized protein N7510_001821 [Penicillium lagena]KAJ5625512.1 hypothetical protein N7510_001821 [Penicillium lagena]
MPAAVDSKKRKSSKHGATTSSKRRAVAENDFAERLATIQELETQIAESRKHYNNIATLISMLGAPKNPDLAVAVSLCRVFSRLIAAGNLTDSSRAADNEKIIVAWLKERCVEYQKALLAIMAEADAASQITALTLGMRLVKERVTHIPSADNTVWTSGMFKDIFEAVVEAPESDLRTDFVAKFVQEYDDVRYHTFAQVAEYGASKRSPEVLERLIEILSASEDVPDVTHEFENFYTETKNKRLVSVSSHKKRAQEAWLAILRNNLSQSQRKTLLRIMAPSIEPWFSRPELLMDFLTDSYNEGGSMSLLALSGLFYLIQEKNLDYPQFYQKLYSLLNADLLHSKHRSRLSRQFHQASVPAGAERAPSAIVVIVPFIYNFFKSHPTCTFMMHRANGKPGMQEDPFDSAEPDPTRTNALESSIWEIETLQSHYHPNVAAIARIISEQFTKQAYNLEDFLDHTYQGMVHAELGEEERPMRKVPVVEYQIPKRIFTDRLLEEDGGVDSGPGCFLRELWDFS